ncbi:hypothetical protein C2E23DRAFT_929687 [Lenzites betulinus]|nr:hypothetical protein C2E23DRAFT_929687 [Lenzites betulinus]
MRSRISGVFSATTLLCLLCSTGPVSAGQTNVTWISPVDGDAYGSGDTLVGRWSADKAVVSPSFRICMTDDSSGVSSRSEDDSEDKESGDDETGDSSGGSCGAAVWPTIGQSDGSYFVHMALPNVSSVAQCYLEMVDDFGDKMASPTFSFGVSADDTTSSEATDADASSSGVPATGTGTGTDAETPSTPTSKPAPSSSNSLMQPAQAPIAQGPQTPQTPLELDESHVPVPTAAYAVPLSLVISVLLAAGGLGVHQRRKLQHERQREQARPAAGAPPLSRHSTLSFAGFVGLGLGARPHSSRSGSSHGGLGRGAGRVAGGVAGERRQPAESRSTSVSTMRAWRRDVSRHERRPVHETRRQDSDSQATLAWPADADYAPGASAAGGGGKGSHFTSIPQREPRRHTREPFQVQVRTGPARAAATVPARVFRAAVSPIFPSTESDRYSEDNYHYKEERKYRPSYSYEGEEAVEQEWRRLNRSGCELVDPGVVARDPYSHSRHAHPGEARRTRDGGAGAYLDASVTDSVVDRYCSASPVPRSPPRSPPHRSMIPVSVSRPERLHVRRYADDGEERERDIRREREARRAPRDPERDLYDAVARQISREPDA